MENKFKEHLINQYKELHIFSNESHRIISQYLRENEEGFQEIRFNEMTIEERRNLDYNSEIMKSTNFKLNCIYELFPNLLEEDARLMLPYKENEEFDIFPDLMDLRSKQNYLDIAGNKIKCGEKITKNEYQELFNSAIKEMIEQEKLTPEMINECTSMNIANELNKIYNTTTNISK